MTGPQHAHRPGFDDVSRCQLQPIALRHRRQNQLPFQQRKVYAQAGMRSRAKRIIGIGWALRRAFSRKALRHKLLWMLPERRLAMRQIGTGQDQGPGWHPIAIKLILFYGFTWENPPWWIEAQRLLKDHAGVAEA